MAATAARAAEREGPRRQGRFLDLLLLGAPDGRTELLEGKVIRQIGARDASRARALFKAVAREMTEMPGIGWRNRLIEGLSTYEVGRYCLTVTDAGVELEVAVDPALWRLFSVGPS